MAEDNGLREQVATLRADHAALGQRVSGLEGVVGGLRVDIDTKHRENRATIHQLRNVAQGCLDEVHKLALAFAAYTGASTGANGVWAKVLSGIWMIVGGAAVAVAAELIKRAMRQ